MTCKTLLPGKDLALEDTIDNATALLTAMDLPTEAVSWLNPAPNCWSVHIQSVACPHLYTNGKGTSQLASLASGLGEFFERLATNLFFADYFLGDKAVAQPFYFYPDEVWFPPGDDDSIPHHNRQGVELLNKDLRSFYHRDEELTAAHLRDSNIDSRDGAICTLPFQSLSTGQTTYFPVSLLNNLYVSNGMAAGNSPAECCSQALSEIIERYVKNRVIAQGISLPDVPQTRLAKYPKLCTILDMLAERKLSVRVKDASLGGQYPVVTVLVADPDSGGVFAAFGANCRFETAVERTLTELLQGRNLDQFKGFQPPCHDLEQVADPFNLESHFVDSDGLLSWNMFKDKADYNFSPWDFIGSTEQELHRLQQLITTSGFHAYRAEYLHCGMYSCRILVPGMSEIYPVDDMVWNNKGSGAALRPSLLRLTEMNQRELTRLFTLLETLGLSDEQLISQTIGVLFDEQSPWGTLRIGELKALLLLALGRKEEAFGWCSWCIDYGALPAARTRLYRLLQSLLDFHRTGADIHDFTASLTLFYRENELHEAISIVNGTTRFPGLNFAGSWPEISAEHKNMLQIYNKIHSIKATFPA
ncbi:30S ribosomal protein S12 methylthiotransferase accessory protein YcaO [Desulfopila sp. IMCC35006]|uniref:YcaO-like family protein n=1 Tax=Desulfopila sp. IMCC35006 TaxID=2569542 RepID=UPI0010AD31A3|nr:YcaO-like family protein [Desulfopila sp. IMCC35006]TKB25754.1 30S ribosomal protein S12 methylthiotransferase accessory protein YcaO [Desulfopila sp. IMCC35006]